MNVWHFNIWDITPHQLDVIRTFASVAGGVGGFVSCLVAVFSWSSRKFAKQAAEQTRTSTWVDGKIRSVSTAEMTNRAMHDTNEVRGEITHMVNQIMPKTHGRRRQPTAAISTYKGENE